MTFIYPTNVHSVTYRCRIGILVQINVHSVIFRYIYRIDILVQINVHSVTYRYILGIHTDKCTLWNIQSFFFDIFVPDKCTYYNLLIRNGILHTYIADCIILLHKCIVTYKHIKVYSVFTEWCLYIICKTYGVKFKTIKLWQYFSKWRFTLSKSSILSVSTLSSICYKRMLQIQVW